MRQLKYKKVNEIPSIDSDELPACFVKKIFRKGTNEYYCSKRWTCSFTTCGFKFQHLVRFKL